MHLTVDLFMALVQHPTAEKYFKGIFPDWSLSANPACAGATENGSIFSQGYRSTWGHPRRKEGLHPTTHRQLLKQCRLPSCYLPFNLLQLRPVHSVMTSLDFLKSSTYLLKMVCRDYTTAIMIKLRCIVQPEILAWHSTTDPLSRQYSKHLMDPNQWWMCRSAPLNDFFMVPDSDLECIFWCCVELATTSPTSFRLRSGGPLNRMAKCLSRMLKTKYGSWNGIQVSMLSKILL